MAKQSLLSCVQRRGWPSLRHGRTHFPRPERHYLPKPKLSFAGNLPIHTRTADRRCPCVDVIAVSGGSRETLPFPRMLERARLRLSVPHNQGLLRALSMLRVRGYMDEGQLGPRAVGHPPTSKNRLGSPPKDKRMKTEPINWSLVERLCLRSFTGSALSEDEMRVLTKAYQEEPEEYARRTHAVRDEERTRLRRM